MNYGLYCAYLGMRARQQRLDSIANNIANASTSGFKADRLLYRSVEAGQADQQARQPADGTTDATSLPGNAIEFSSPRLTATKYGRDVGVVTSQTIDFSPGTVHETGRPLDLALNGDGFMVVQTPRGERYTRGGNFTLDPSGQLVTQNGDLVVGEGGPITIPAGNVSLGSDGSIFVNGQSVGQLKLVEFANPALALVKEGSCLFLGTGSAPPTEATNTRVVSGALELSNVNPLTEMVAMMQNTREFESLQRSATMLMNDLGRTIASEIGKI